MWKIGIGPTLVPMIKIYLSEIGVDKLCLHFSLFLYAHDLPIPIMLLHLAHYSLNIYFQGNHKLHDSVQLYMYWTTGCTVL